MINKIKEEAIKARARLGLRSGAFTSHKSVLREKEFHSKEAFYPIESEERNDEIILKKPFRKSKHIPLCSAEEYIDFVEEFFYTMFIKKHADDWGSVYATNNIFPDTEWKKEKYVFEDGELPTYHFKYTDAPIDTKTKLDCCQNLCGDKIIWEQVDVTETIKNFVPRTVIPFDFKGKNCGLFIPKGVLLINPNEDDKMIAIINRTEKFCHFYDHPYERVVHCAAIVSEEVLKIFGKIEDYKKLIEELKQFSRFSKAQQERLIERAEAPDFCGFEDDLPTPFVKIDDLKLMYKLCKHTLSPDIKKMLDSNFELADSLPNNENRANILTQICYALNIDFTPKSTSVNKSFNEIMELFDAKMYGLEELKENIAEFLVSMIHSGQNNFAICIVGSPGVGKTAFAELMAEVFSVKLAYVNCSCNGALAIAGLIKSYSGAQPSKISKSLLKEGTNNVLLHLDEFDKMTTNDKDGDPYSALLEALGYQRRFGDQFFDDGFFIPFDDVKTVCTVNDINKIPDYVLNRFDEIFYCDDYNAEQKVAIAKRHTIAKLFKFFRIKDGEIVFTDSALNEIAVNYCTDRGAREMEHYLKKTIRKVIRLWSNDECSKPTVVDSNFVKTYIRKSDPRISNKRTMGF